MIKIKAIAHRISEMLFFASAITTDQSGSSSRTHVKILSVNEDHNRPFSVEDIVFPIQIM